MVPYVVMREPLAATNDLLFFLTLRSLPVAGTTDTSARLSTRKDLPEDRSRRNREVLEKEEEEVTAERVPGASNARRERFPELAPTRSSWGRSRGLRTSLCPLPSEHGSDRAQK